MASRASRGAPSPPWYASSAVLGVGRALDPSGALPHIARVLDAAAPILPEEAELAVEALNVDATSYRVIRERCEGEPERMAACIAAIVRERGKLQNPWTGSGGSSPAASPPSASATGTRACVPASSWCRSRR